VIGTHKFSYDIFGDTVNTAARMQQHGVTGSIQMTQATYDLVRHRYSGTARQLTVKGKGRMRTWLLEPTSAAVVTQSSSLPGTSSAGGAPKTKSGPLGRTSTVE
jgi:class 3 adenylate cyclase